MPTPRPLRIAFFTFAFPPVLTGVSLGAYRRVKWLLERGHEVLLVHPQIGPEFADEVRHRDVPGVESLVRFSNLQTYAYPTKPHRFRESHPEPLSHRHWSDTRLLREFQPDVVVVDDAAGMKGYSSFLLGGYRRTVGLEYVLETGVPRVNLYETDWLSYAKPYLGPLYGLGCWLTGRLRSRRPRKHTDTLFCSRHLTEKYATMGTGRGRYLPFNGVDVESFHPRNRRSSPLPGDDRPTILFVGRLSREKNVELLLDMMPNVLDRVPHAHLVVVGDGPAVPRLKQRARRLGEAVTLWGESHGDELRGLFARADVFVNPSVTENFCTTNLEANASGTPVVAAAAGGNTEQVDDGVTGFHARPDDFADLADKTARVLENESLRTSMGTAARRFVLDFDQVRCNEQLEAFLYERCALQYVTTRARDAVVTRSRSTIELD